MTQTIQKDKYYKLSEVVNFHPILQQRGIRFLYDYRMRQVPNLFTNTSQPGKKPRYFIRGTDLLLLINNLDKPRLITKS